MTRSKERPLKANWPSPYAIALGTLVLGVLAFAAQCAQTPSVQVYVLNSLRPSGRPLSAPQAESQANPQARTRGCSGGGRGGKSDARDHRARQPDSGWGC